MVTSLLPLFFLNSMNFSLAERVRRREPLSGVPVEPPAVLPASRSRSYSLEKIRYY
jgi:hypothetical protein